jgi:hypothetical protein
MLSKGLTNTFKTLNLVPKNSRFNNSLSKRITFNVFNKKVNATFDFSISSNEVNPRIHNIVSLMNAKGIDKMNKITIDSKFIEDNHQDIIAATPKMLLPLQFLFRYPSITVSALDICFLWDEMGIRMLTQPGFYAVYGITYIFTALLFCSFSQNSYYPTFSNIFKYRKIANKVNPDLSYLSVFRINKIYDNLVKCYKGNVKCDNITRISSHVLLRVLYNAVEANVHDDKDGNIINENLCNLVKANREFYKENLKEILNELSDKLTTINETDSESSSEKKRHKNIISILKLLMSQYSHIMKADYVIKTHNGTEYTLGKYSLFYKLNLFNELNLS